MDMGYEKLDSETIEMVENMNGLMDEHWKHLSREMGLKSDSGHYGEDNSLIARRYNMENIAAGGVVNLLEEEP